MDHLQRAAARKTPSPSTPKSRAVSTTRKGRSLLPPPSEPYRMASSRRSGRVFSPGRRCGWSSAVEHAFGGVRDGDQPGREFLWSDLSRHAAVPVCVRFRQAIACPMRRRGSRPPGASRFFKVEAALSPRFGSLRHERRIVRRRCRIADNELQAVLARRQVECGSGRAAAEMPHMGNNRGASAG